MFVIYLERINTKLLLIGLARRKNDFSRSAEIDQLRGFGWLPLPLRLYVFDLRHTYLSVCQQNLHFLHP